MRNKKLKITIGIVMLVVAAALFQYRVKGKASNVEVTIEVKPVVGSVQDIISTTGTILPKNRLEVKPPVNGRIEEVLVREGEYVKKGQTLVWMSSTERAALLDAARGQGEEVLKYWQQVYKAIPLISPIDGEVIVATTQPGQTMTTSDAVLVLSDQLIIRAQVDETDIGSIKLGQDAVVTIDAYPENSIKAKTGHIYYESETVNNVTMYNVDLVPETVPDFFRSGMNATINFIKNNKADALLVPSEAVTREKDKAYLSLKRKGDKEIIRQEVKLGIPDGKNIEVISGIKADDAIMVKTKKYELPKSSAGTNPFMPSRNNKK
ncbi:MAG: efflux RND transporter periplasmic adaptor subunit [Candidatus Omnitrophica bacterium]|nr:efflux RND transporter periplasmic adaptor subunit [Candidatus Omnitrophota bacterium]